MQQILGPTLPLGKLLNKNYLWANFPIPVFPFLGQNHRPQKGHSKGQKEEERGHRGDRQMGERVGGEVEIV